MNTKALYNLTYGVYLLSAQEAGKDNGCIINTAVQVANHPARLSIAVIKGNLTHDMILHTGKFNLSTITTEAEFSLFQRFGMKSGREGDKFAGFSGVARSGNGLYYLTKWSNTFLSLRVVETYDLGSHTLVIGEVEDAEVLSSVPACSYGYYQSSIKKRAPKPAEKKGWMCSVCGYIYEGDPLPEDFICPICKHGAEVFEPVGGQQEKPALQIPAAAPAPSSGRTWVCSVCGYVCEGENPPEKCPRCGVPASKFTGRKGE